MKTILFNGHELDIAGIHSDSRKIQPGYLFVAVKGTQSDGHDYIEKAIENGATVIVHQSSLTEHGTNQPVMAGLTRPPIFIQVKDSTAALGELASLYNNEPSKKLTLVGVTGTNGKTTIATLLYTMFRKLGYKVGLLSTVCNYVDDKEVPATHTTPDPIELNNLLAQMVAAG
jgi:UDP-N-acetylmuramoyl-L-alanyl-D-glutamate--2,6-diaminopimelate ligase